MIAGSAAHIVGNEESHGFIDSIRPCCGIVEVETTGFIGFVRGFYQVRMSSSHGFLGIFLIGEYICGPHSHADGERGEENSRGDTEMFPSFISYGDSEFGKKEHPNKHGDIITHLRMQEETDVGEEHNDDCSPSILLAVCQDEPHQDQCHPGDRNGFATMRCGYNDEEITAHGDGKRAG